VTFLANESLSYLGYFFIQDPQVKDLQVETTSLLREVEREMIEVEIRKEDRVGDKRVVLVRRSKLFIRNEEGTILSAID
jgi:hypothetical protein